MDNLQAFLILFLTCLMCVQSTNKTFVPTEQWQTIEEGTTVPAGLHVRINLQTGKKEAKLVDNKNTKSSLIATKENEPPTADDIKEMLKKIKNEDSNVFSFGNKQKLRSYDDLKEELEGVDLNIKTEFEILASLINEYRSIKNNTVQVENTQERLESIVMELTELVHQYDNAIEFTRLNGFEELVVPCLNSSADQAILKSNMLKLVGAAAQNNPRVQKAAMGASCIPLFLRMIAQEEDNNVRARLISALSAVLRHNPDGLLSFLRQGGLSVLASEFDDKKRPDNRIRFKIVNLMTDWIRELRDSVSIAESHIERSYELVVENFGTREGGWCARAANWFIAASTTEELDHSIVEGSASFLIELANQDCGDDLRINLKLLVAVNVTKELYEDLALQDQDDGKTESYFLDILNTLKHLSAILAGTSKYRDEL